MHFLSNVSSLECKRPVICDINLEGVNVENLQASFLVNTEEVKGCMEILTSGLIEAAAFPPAFVHPELLQLCIDYYDVRSKSIVSKNGNVILSVSRETISSVLKLTTSTFATFSPIQAEAEYRENPSVYRNTLARKWTKVNYGGGSRLPKVITRSHMKPHIHDLVVLLHRVKGSADVCLFEEWMYRYIEIILKGEQWIDWAEIIATSLRSQLKHAKESKEDFCMASYLTYCIACTYDLAALPHEVWNEEMTIFQYCPLLQKDRVLEDFRKVHDILFENIYLALEGVQMPRLSSESLKLVQYYGSSFIQFPRFTYLRVERFEEEPVRLPRYALDCFILAELCRQLSAVIKDNLPQDKWETVFPIKLHSLVCNNMNDVSIIGSNLLGFNLGFYRSRRNFDSKGYAALTLGLEINSTVAPQLEDLWEDCENEEEVLKKDHSRLTLQQINSFKLKFKTQGIVEDGSCLVEPEWEESNETKFLTVDWSKEEDDDINWRARSILTYTDDWLQRKRTGNINESSTKVISLSEPLQSDIPLSHVAGDTLASNKKIKFPSQVTASTLR